MARLLRTFLILVVLVAAAAGGGLYAAWQMIDQPGPTTMDGSDSTIVLLERGIGVKTIATRLEAAGVIRDARVFVLYIRFTGDGARLKAGEYAIPSGASMAQILDILKEGKSILHKLTVAEGLTSAQAMRIVAADEILVGELGDTPAEGSLLPETYLFLRGTSRQDLVADMKASHDAALAELWPNRKAGLPFDTPEEAVIIASIVEKETGLAEERPRVAAVFVNRMKRGMRLQSDPTVVYGLTQGEPLGRGLRRSELDRETPYNTYVIDGLPPTPIANPGRASLEAVLNPPDTKDLYFVADGTGGHVFAETLREHTNNVRKWRKIERERKRVQNK